MIWALLVGLAALAEPSEHTLLYYNARMALREGSPDEAIKLWLLRNALEDATGEVSAHDEDFASVTWAALGELGICADGHHLDRKGAGLWPLAMHNWVVRNMGRRGKNTLPRPFDAFNVGRQQRFVSITDVLSADELRTVELLRGGCLRPKLLMIDSGELPNAKFSDRQVAGRFMRHLIYRAQLSLATERVKGLAVLEARLFDINLQLAALAEREARQQAREQSQLARQLGLSATSADVMRADAPSFTFSDGSEPARILRGSLEWPTEEWMSLSPERRLFLFDSARKYRLSPNALDEIALGIIDTLIAAGEGEEVEKWIARYAPDDPTRHAAIWGGERGQSLLSLDESTGFAERATIALHRGVGSLQQGDMSGALKSLAYAMQSAPASEATAEITRLSRRWLSYVSGQYEITDELLVTLQQLIPRRDYAIILEDMLWRAAFHADQTSFERGLTNQQGRGALGRRVDLLYPLAVGDVGRFLRQIRSGLSDSPSETMRFIEQFVGRIEREDGDIRASHQPTLLGLTDLLRPLSPEGGGTGRPARNAAELMARIQSILEGLDGIPNATTAEQARSLDPDGVVFAGSVRLAPVDPLPWPFVASNVPAPSVFTPIPLTPEEWRDEDGELVFGWRIGE